MRLAGSCTAGPEDLSTSRHGPRRLSVRERSYLPDWHRGKSPYMVKDHRPRREEQVQEPCGDHVEQARLVGQVGAEHIQQQEEPGRELLGAEEGGRGDEEQARARTCHVGSQGPLMPQVDNEEQGERDQEEHDHQQHCLLRQEEHQMT